MRILHVLAPAPYGGLERVVAALTAGMSARGHDVHVAAVLECEGEGHPFLRELRVPAHVIRAPGRAYGAEMAAVGALRHSLRPHVVHTHGYRADVLHGRPAGATGIPSTTTVHGFTGGGPRNQLYEAMQRLALRRFDAVVAVSEPLARQLRVTVPGDRVRTIPNAWSPVEPPLPRADARARLGIGAGEFVAGWVGRLSHEKGADVLLDALPALPGARASFLGDGADEAALRARAARRGTADRVRWHGAVPEAAALYGAFDVFVLSSRTEGTPIALFEAIAAGVPVVAARVGGVPDVVGPGEAWLVPPDDPAALAAALADVRASPDQARARADAARRRLETVFGCVPWLDAYESLYGSLVSRSAR